MAFGTTKQGLLLNQLSTGGFGVNSAEVSCESRKQGLLLNQLSTGGFGFHRAEVGFESTK